MILVNLIGVYITVKIKGICFKGSGESSQWMPKYIPWLFPGTLNVKLEMPKPTINWEEFIDNHYAEVRPDRCHQIKIAKCKVNGEDAFIVLPPCAKEKKKLNVELGATFKIRDKFNLQDGDQVEVEFL